MRSGKGIHVQIEYNIDKEYEDEFVNKCQEIAMYQSVKRTTLDGEWTEEELRDDIYDVCVEIMTEIELKKYTGRALHDQNLLKISYMSESISAEIDDVIELYNTEYDKHRQENKFGIYWYDETIKKLIIKKLKGNLVVR